MNKENHLSHGLSLALLGVIALCLFVLITAPPVSLMAG